MRFRCPRCPREFPTLVGLSVHWRRTTEHPRGTARTLCVEMLYGGVPPTCRCGCGQEPTFLDITRGFREWVKGHAAKVRNNWGHNPKAITRSIETRRRRSAEGTLRGGPGPWLGKTKDTDPRLAERARLQKEKWGAVYSERMREARSSGDPRWVTKRGPESSQWRGGVSSLQAVCRTLPSLYQNWKLPHLIRAGFKCERCSSTLNLQVHHTTVSMSSIVRRVSSQFSWENIWSSQPDKESETQAVSDLKHTIAETVASYHQEHQIPGEVLCSKCHGKIHNRDLSRFNKTRGHSPLE